MDKTLADLHERAPGLPPIFTKPPSDGWLYPEVADMLTRHLNPGVRVVVEVGAWLGKSTRHILDQAPNAVVYCVDTWKGSPEHERLLGYNYEALISTLYERFVDACWEYRGRIYPVRGLSSSVLPQLAEAGIEPDVCYIDGSHAYADVLRDLEDCISFWPGAKLLGDDYHDTWPDVVRAVDDAARRHRMRVSANGRGWWIRR